MRTVWKFDLEVGYQVIDAPEGAAFLSVQYQGQQLRTWALVDPNAPMARFGVLVTGTGFPIGDVADLRYIGTVQNGVFVWHAFWEPQL